MDFNHRNSKPSNTSPTPGKLRIMAGQWKGRNISFPALETLRPTGSRIRETLFNWLQPYIAQTTCLDLFAGSGILGFEALSRGANKVLAVDALEPAVQQLQAQAEKLQTTALTTMQHNAYELVQRTPAHWQIRYPNRIHSNYDIIFIDPPFSDNRLSEICAALTQNHWMKKNCLIYVEKNKKQDFIVPTEWNLLKNKVAGAVNYQLYSASSVNE